jgi:hypothetical protein
MGRSYLLQQLLLMMLEFSHHVDGLVRIELYCESRRSGSWASCVGVIEGLARFGVSEACNVQKVEAPNIFPGALVGAP